MNVTKKKVYVEDLLACCKAKETLESKVKPILERRLTEDYIDGGDFKFEKCVIREGKSYLGFIHFFAIGEDGEVFLDIQLDKDPYNLYTMSLGNELFVGSKLYKVFAELEIVDCNGNADIGDLNYQPVRVTLKRSENFRQSSCRAKDFPRAEYSIWQWEHPWL